MLMKLIMMITYYVEQNGVDQSACLPKWCWDCIYVDQSVVENVQLSTKQVNQSDVEQNFVECS